MFYKVAKDGLNGDSTWFIRLEKGEEILESLTGFCKKFNHYTGATGTITGIGAVSYAEIGWFDPECKKYVTNVYQENREITSLIGNLSLKEKEPFFHIHVTLSNRQFEVIGGHLYKAIISATGELVLRTFRLSGTSTDLKRKPDQETGLYLWDEMQRFEEIG
ncbi:DNA-binding protein [bacterium]|nr:DNA-binding protein [bacterium]